MRAEGLIESVSAKYISIVHYLYNLILTTPQAKRKLKKQLAASRIELKQKLITDKEDKVQTLVKRAELPEVGQTRDQLSNLLTDLEKIHKVDYESGKVRWVAPFKGLRGAVRLLISALVAQRSSLPWSFERH